MTVPYQLRVIKCIASLCSHFLSLFSSSLCSYSPFHISSNIFSTTMSLLTLTVLSSAAAILYILYRAALPKPIHGIPYNKKAARSILGDSK